MIHLDLLFFFDAGGSDGAGAGLGEEVMLSSLPYGLDFVKIEKVQGNHS